MHNLLSLRLLVWFLRAGRHHHGGSMHNLKVFMILCTCEAGYVYRD